MILQLRLDVSGFFVVVVVSCILVLVVFIQDDFLI